jgi:hypothetical protein
MELAPLITSLSIRRKKPNISIRHLGDMYRDGQAVTVLWHRVPQSLSQAITLGTVDNPTSKSGENETRGQRGREGREGRWTMRKREKQSMG